MPKPPQHDAPGHFDPQHGYGAAPPVEIEFEAHRVEIHNHIHIHLPHELTEQLGRIERTLGTIRSTEAKMSGELDKLEQDVAAQATVIDSAVELLKGLKAKLDEAIAAGDMSRVSAVTAEIEARTQALADAVAANTPAATP